MKKRIVLILFGCLLIAGIVVLAVKVFPHGKAAAGDIGNAECIKAVPADASALLLFNDFGDAGEVLADTSSIFAGVFPSRDGLSGFSRKLLSLKALGGNYADFSKTDAVYSFHCQGYGSLGILLSVTLPSGVTDKDISNTLKGFYKDAQGVPYDEYEVSYSSGAGIYYSIVGRTLIASESMVLAESAVRHRASDISVAENPDFQEVYKALKARTALYFHNGDADRLFGALMDRTSAPRAALSSTFADWTALSLDFSRYGFSYTGTSVAPDPRKCYSEVLKKQAPAATEAYKVLPYYTYAAASLKISDKEAYLKSYSVYLDANRRSAAYERSMSDSLKKWFGSQTVSEMTLAGIQVSGKTEWITLFRTDKVLSKNPKDWAWFASRFASFFTMSSSDDITLLPGWVIIGSVPAIAEYRSNNAFYISLDEYLSRNDVRKETAGKSVLSLFFNFDRQGERAYRMFNAPLGANLYSAFDSTSFEMLTCNMANADENGGTDLTGNFDALYADEILVDIEKDTTREVHQGPSKLVDPTTGEIHYLEQAPNGFLRYSDASHKGLWAAPFDRKLVGDVCLVDLFHNKNYQMLFAAGDSFYYLDKTAHYVGHTPKSLGKVIVLGPRVYSMPDSSKAFMVLFEDNSVGLYTLEGNLYKNWRGIECKETIKHLPEPMEIGGKRYWVLRTPMQTLICRFDGTAAATFEKNSRLKPKSEITPMQGSQVRVNCYDGKNYLLDLEKGTFKRIKK